jgi:hypothetical protein
VTIIPGADGGRIEFQIKGAPVAWIDERGLHVIGDIEYGGAITDSGLQMKAPADDREAPHD